MPHHIKYRQLRAFASLVETGSFKAAADQLAVTQPSLSVLVQELERDVGVKLFDRSTRRGEPTSEGRGFYERIKGSMDNLDDAYTYIKEVGQGTRGKLRVACLSSLAAGIMTTKLAQFHERYPHVQIRLHETTFDVVPEVVRKGEADFGIGAEIRADADLVFQPIFKDRLMIVAPAGHALAGKRVTWKSLDPYKLVMVVPGPASRALRTANVSKTPAFEVEHAATALAMVRNQLGISVLPSSVAEGLNVDGLVCLPLPGPSAVRNLGIIRKRKSSPTPAAMAFLSLLGHSWTHVPTT
ncbi:MAG: LysR family transcriptional regulator [Pseudomonadota bacterium]